MNRILTSLLTIFSILLMYSCSFQPGLEEGQEQQAVMQMELDPAEVSISAEHLKPEFLDKFRNIPVTGRSGSTGEVTLVKAEYLTLGSSGKMGTTVFFSNVGNKQLPYDFLAGDPRSLGGDLTVYAIDPFDGTTASGLSAAETGAAIDRAMATWNSVQCSDPLLAKNTSIPFDIGVVEAILGFGGNEDFFFGDIQHAGFLPALFFEFLTPGGGTGILGVTFTFTWNQDLNGDGLPEVAFREIYYNDGFFWADGANIDVETVALHEAGHGLSQAHFGTAFADAGAGYVHFSPRAVMNAAYSGVQTSIEASDNAGHCSLWADWPNN